MIRTFTSTDLDTILKIWLESNLQTHSFIPLSYWTSHLDFMRQVLPQAELYVYELEEQVVAFAGLQKDYIAGIFTKKEYRSQGIGKQLIEFLKKSHSNLSLSVYEKNRQAIEFYLREGFQIRKEGMDTENQEKEFLMYWKSDDESSFLHKD